MGDLDFEKVRAVLRAEGMVIRRHRDGDFSVNYMGGVPRDEARCPTLFDALEAGMHMSVCHKHCSRRLS